MSEIPEGAFEPVRDGVFQQRMGPAHARGEEPCQKKLCFTATDQAFLAGLLYELSLDEECWGVKYSTEPCDGMYLGRCFFTTAERAGRAWARYKPHPKLMCSIQDDEFTKAFRPSDAAEKASW